MRKFIALAAIALIASAGTAAAAGKGTSLLSIGLGQGSAETYSTVNFGGTNDYIAPSSSPETSIGASYWYQFSDDYAFALSGAYGMGSQKWESSGEPEVKATTSSFKVRVGGDRVGSVGDRFKMYMGPGLEFWNGKSKIDIGGTETESEGITRIGVSGRIGGIMMLSDNLGISGEVGHTFGIASVEEGPAKSSWWPNSFNAFWGLTFAFGGE